MDYNEQKEGGELEGFEGLGVYPKTFFADGRPERTYCANNGTLAFVDNNGYLHLTLGTSHNIQLLRDRGYKFEQWGVPGSNNEIPEYVQWRTNSNYALKSNEAATFEVPDIPYVGPFNTSRHSTPGEFVYNKDGKTITWHCHGFPVKGGTTSGHMVSPNTPDVVAKLKAAGYRESNGWFGIKTEEVSNDTRSRIDDMLKGL